MNPIEARRASGLASARSRALKKGTDPATKNRAAIQAAKDNIAYYTHKKAQATLPADRAHAGGLLSAWQHQLAHLQSAI